MGENKVVGKSIQFNQIKTKEILKDLKNEGVDISIENISQYLRKQGVIVKVHVGRIRNFIDITPKIFGVDLSSKNSEVNTFVKEHMKIGKMKFIPDSYEKTLINIEGNVRNKKNRLSIGYEDSFMPIESYKEYLNEFNELKKMYLEQRDFILDNWDSLINSFKINLKQTLEELNAIEKETLFEAIMTKIPTKTEYQDSFRMFLTVRAFPVVENVSLLDDELQEDIKNSLYSDTLDTVYEVVGLVLNDAFRTINNTAKAVEKNDRISGPTVKSIKNTICKMQKRNIFHNQKIINIANELKALLNISDADSICEKCESLLSLIYGYSSELGALKYIDFKDCILSKEELKEIYEIAFAS